MTECVVFMDGLHLRVKDYITLTLWVENPIICKTQRLASMECTSEDTENVTIFLQNFLAILCDVKKDLNYMWKPCMIMADENSANVITDNFHHLLMKFHIYVWTHFYTPNDKN